jgi:hypothetical protein
MRVWRTICYENFDAVDKNDENTMLILAEVSPRNSGRGSWQQAFVLPHWRLAA